MSQYDGVYISRSEERKEHEHPRKKPSYSAMYLPNGELTCLGKRWLAGEKEREKKNGKG